MDKHNINYTMYLMINDEQFKVNSLNFNNLFYINLLNFSYFSNLYQMYLYKDEAY